VAAAAASLLASAANAEPLLLTPLLKAGKLSEARNASAIQVGDISLGHSGYFTVDSTSGKQENNIFTWFQPCSDGCAPTDPFVMWFQGGPGGPGTFGAFAEIGSHYVDKHLTLQKREYAWCAKYNCLFIDQPVQTGFSYSINKATGKFDPDHIEYTATSKEAMAQSLDVLLQFFELFPQYHSSDAGAVLPDFYIAGESYGGLYTANMAAAVTGYNANPTTKLKKINIKGVAVGDPIINWKHQMPTYANTLYGMGVIMKEQHKQVEGIMEAAVAALDTNCTEAFAQWNSVWNDDGGGGAPGLYYEMTGSSMTENVLLGEAPDGFSYWSDFLKKPDIQKAFHFDGVPTSSSDEGGPVYHTMVKSRDFCTPSSDIFASFIGQNENVKLMIFSSTSDPLLGPPTTEAGVEAVAEDPHANFDWAEGKRVIWKVADTDKNVAGYAKCVLGHVGNRFCYVVARNGGHELPAFQPRAAYDMFRRFVENKEFDASGDDAKVPTAPECSGVPPFAGPEVIPACNQK